MRRYVDADNPAGSADFARCCDSCRARTGRSIQNDSSGGHLHQIDETLSDERKETQCRFVGAF